jgi:hypothetical protein
MLAQGEDINYSRLFTPKDMHKTCIRADLYERIVWFEPISVKGKVYPRDNLINWFWNVLRIYETCKV